MVVIEPSSLCRPCPLNSSIYRPPVPPIGLGFAGGRCDVAARGGEVAEAGDDGDGLRATCGEPVRRAAVGPVCV
jgi:hypothetical protein